MKKFAFALSAVALVFAALSSNQAFAQSQTRYVSDSFHVPLRETPCARCKIVHWGIPSGTKLDFIEWDEAGEWGHVKTPAGLEGWMEKQYLLDEPVAAIRLEQVQAQLDTTSRENQRLKSLLAQNSSSTAELDTALESVEKDYASVVRELTELKEISANAVELNDQNQALLVRNKNLQSELDVLNARVESLQRDEKKTFMAYGGLLVLAGVLIAIIVPRLRRKKGYSEWG